jgi:hypothetical protein
VIELRWLKRGGEQMYYPGNGEPIPGRRYPVERVLQFRATTTTTAEEFHETGMRRVRYMEWSEWKDVPEVIAESAARERS